MRKALKDIVDDPKNAKWNLNDGQKDEHLSESRVWVAGFDYQTWLHPFHHALTQTISANII